MKKFLLSLLLSLSVGVVSTHAETITITPSNMTGLSGSAYGSSTFTVSDATFTAQKVMSTGQIRVTKNGSEGFNLHNTTAISGIKKITLTADQPALGTWYMRTSSSEAVTKPATTSDIAGVKSGSTITFTVPEGTDASYFHINLTANGSGVVKFSTIEIEYTKSTELSILVIKYGDDNKPVFDEESVSVPQGTMFTISADNAESINITNSGNQELLNVNGNTCTWTPDVMGEDMITVTATKGDKSLSAMFILAVLADAGLSFPETSYSVKINEQFDTPLLTKATSANPVYSSSNTAVAEVNSATGVVDIIGKGETVITAKTAATTTHAAGEASYTLTVIDPNEPETLTDVIAISCFKNASTKTYTETTYESEETQIVYTAKIMNGNDAIQMNADTKTSLGRGIATTSNPKGYILKSVSVKFNTNTEDGRVINVYGAGSGFDNISDVKTYGTEIGSITKSTNSDQPGTIVPDQPSYKAVGFLAPKAIYVDEITLVWAKASGSTGISEIEAEGTATEWFDLSGRRVAAPAKGIYLRKQGSKVTKIAY